MRLIKLITLIIILSFSFLACDADRCFKNEGAYGSSIIEYDSLIMVNVMGVFDIELVQDTQYFVEIFAHEQVVRGIELELIRDSLFCYNYNNCFWRRDFKSPLLRIHFSDLQHVHIDESSYVFSTDSIRDDFKFTVGAKLAEADLIFSNEKVYFYINKTSGGIYKFRGKTNTAFLMNFNTGLMDMSELECKTARVLNFSIIDMKVNVTERLNVEIFNEGNIYYKGSPELIIDTLASSGRAIPF